MCITEGLAALLHRERKRHKLTLAKVGALAGVDRTLIWKIEKKKSLNPSIIVLMGISTALSVPFHDVCDAALVDAQDSRSRS